MKLDRFLFYSDLSDLVNRRADEGDMISVKPSDTLMTAYNRMRASDISQIPVLDDGELIGVIDEEDILFSVKNDRSSFEDEVRACMVTNLDILQPNASEDDLVGILTQGKVAIIYDGEKFIGFVTKVDLINHYRTRIDQVS